MTIKISVQKVEPEINVNLSKATNEIKVSFDVVKKIYDAIDIEDVDENKLAQDITVFEFEPEYVTDLGNGRARITIPGVTDFNLSDLGDVDDTDKAEGKILKVDSEGNHIYVDDEAGTDEKVKYDSEDPTAGYLSDKVIAGDGISVSEDENKLVITNTDKGTDVDLSGKEDVGVAASLDAQHLLDFTHADIAHSNRDALDLVSGTNTGDQTLPINSDFSLSGLSDTTITDLEDGEILVSDDGKWINKKDLDFGLLEFSSRTEPDAPIANSTYMFQESVGTSPNKVVTLYTKNEDGEKIILSTLIT